MALLVTNQRLVRQLFRAACVTTAKTLAGHHTESPFPRSCSSVSNQELLPILSLPPRYLRDMDSSEFDPATHQRSKVRYNPVDGKPMVVQSATTSASRHTITNCTFDDKSDSYQILWEDGLESRFSNQWVHQQLSQWRGCFCNTNDDDGSKNTSRQLWTDLTEEQVRTSSLCLEYHHVVQSANGMSQALKTLYEYGILLVTNTPMHERGVAALAAALGGASTKENNPTSLLSASQDEEEDTSKHIVLPRGTDGPLRTLYGNVWSTSSSFQADGASVADSAYGQEGLPLHTDMTYHQDPPGLQIFTMIQPSVKGGESVFADGFSVANQLQKENPAALKTLSQTIRRYRCLDDVTGWHLEAHGPVIEMRNDQIVGIRHNDLDRLPDLPPAACSCTAEAFYESLVDAHRGWDELLALDKFRLVISLQPGDTMVVANHRCFHGRYSFEATAESPRAVLGCYVSHDELNSRFRQEGFVLP